MITSRNLTKIFYFKISEYYQQGDQCEKCHALCLSCTGPEKTDCLHCMQPLLLHHTRCVPQCPQRYFKLNGRCVPCLHGCASCSSYDNCTACSSHFHLYSGKCIAHCPEGLVLFHYSIYGGLRT